MSIEEWINPLRWEFVGSVSDEAYGLPDSVLFRLKKFLDLELLGRSQNAEDKSLPPHGDLEEEGRLEEEDYLAEAQLEQEVERLAVEDPDVVALEQDEMGSELSITPPDEELPEVGEEGDGDGEHGDGDGGRDPGDGTPQAEDRTALVACTPTVNAEATPKPSFKRQRTRSNGETTGLNPSSKRTRTRQVIDCVLIPTLPTATQATQVSPHNPQPEDVSAPFSDVDSGADDLSATFILTDEECKALEKPATMSAVVNTDLYMRFTFNIDMRNAPGRSRQSSNMTGKAARQVERVQVMQDLTSSSVSNHLIIDPDLSRINCAYLPDYDIIVCQNLHNGKLCGYGVPLASLFLHCWGPDGKKDLSDASDRVPHRIDFCKRNIRQKQPPYMPIQKSFIQRLLSRYPNIVVSVAEMRELRMRPDQFGPIAHIGAPIPGYMCVHCDFAACDLTRDGPEPLSMREHWQQHRRVSPDKHAPLSRGCDLRRSKEFRACAVQSFDRDRCHTLWLPAPPGQNAIQAQPKKSFGQLLLSSQQSGTPISTDLNRKAVLPFFLQNGAYDLIQPLFPSDVARLIGLPRRGEHGFQELKLAVVKRFETLCDRIPTVPDQVRKLLVAPKPEERSIMDRFNRPTRTSTIRSYALEEVRLLCFVLRCIRHSRYAIGASESPVVSNSVLQIGLTSQQFESFQALQQVLSSESKAIPSQLDTLVDATLRSIYMPSNSFYMFDNIFRNPSTAYVVLRSTRAQGGFADPKEMTVHYARIQFGIRLVLMADILKQYDQLWSENKDDQDNSDKVYTQLMEYVQLTVQRWGSEEQISPLAFVRGCMKAMSRMARRAPSGQTITWNTDSTKLAVQNHTVVISEYIHRIQCSLLALANKVNAEILFGIEFPQESFDLPSSTSETNDLETSGFGLFLFDKDTDVDDHPASYFLQQLCKQGQICIRQGDDIIWDVKRFNEWLLTLSNVWSEALALMHLLSLPGRGTEVTSWQYANSPTSPRHLFLSKSLGTLITHSSYNKTTALTGQYKYILRVIPLALATILTKLLRIVRPIETLGFASQFAIGDKLRIQNLYATYIFVSHGKVWDSGRLSASLHNWFVRELKVPFGLHLHRHFAQALQRKYLSYEKDDGLYKIANKVMGHGSQLADLHYAREAQDLNLDASERGRMEQVGRDWIEKVHRLEVSKVVSPIH
ncbi:hypothetical protein J3R83DRAFT_5468 [Lanmaoa asiatica]|nr:hypothetical protein J3R83DRAFT_5468 [Lanmaoa asiatica]